MNIAKFASFWARWFKKWQKKPGTKGFSLIELLVVVGIMGTLAAVAIPAYNKYRTNAARGAFSATGTNIVRAFQACIAVNAYSNCDSLSELDINVPSSTNDGGVSPFFCADMTQEIGGETFKGCFSVSARDSAVITTFNMQVCVSDPVTTGASPPNDCDTNGDGTLDSVKAAGIQGGSCETAAASIERCTTNADCVAEFGAEHTCTSSASQGLCSAAAGTCS